MAELRKTILGKISGAIGDLVFRERDGQNYLATRPSSFMPGDDAASVARRARFALSVRTSSSINGIPELKALWLIGTPAGVSAFNYILKTNYSYVNSTDVTNLLKIVPDNGFGIALTGNTVNNTSVQAIIDPIGVKAGIDPMRETHLMMTCVEFLSNPIDESVSAYSLIGLSSEKVPTNLNIPLTFNAELTSQQTLLYDKYQDRKVFIAILSLDAEGNPVHYSSSVYLS
ncbi:MAG: hypothetical protein IPM14_15005 [bacterium]|nr:hypothetical protein [bacterium]